MVLMIYISCIHSHSRWHSFTFEMGNMIGRASQRTRITIVESYNPVCLSADIHKQCKSESDVHFLVSAEFVDSIQCL